MPHPPDLSAMIEHLERCRQAAAAHDWRHLHLRELAWAIRAFGERSFLEQRRDFGGAAFGGPGASADESRFGWWYAAAPFLDEQPEFRKFSREDVVNCAAQIDASNTAPCADAPTEDQPSPSERERRSRLFWRAGPIVLQRALLDIADEILRVGRCLPTALPPRSAVGTA